MTITLAQHARIVALADRLASSTETHEIYACLNDLQQLTAEVAERAAAAFQSDQEGE